MVVAKALVPWAMSLLLLTSAAWTWFVFLSRHAGENLGQSALFACGAVPALLLGVPWARRRCGAAVVQRCFPALFALAAGLVCVSDVLGVGCGGPRLALVFLGAAALAVLPFALNHFNSRKPELALVDLALFLYAAELAALALVELALAADLGMDFLRQDFAWHYLTLWTAILPVALTLVYRRGLADDFFGLSFTLDRKTLLWSALCGVPLVAAVVGLRLHCGMPLWNGFYSASSFSLVFFLSAFPEEFVYRGGLFLLVARLERPLRGWAPGVAILLAAALFCLAHFNPNREGLAPLLALTFFSGCCWGLLYYKTRNLFACAVSHACMNTFFGL